MNTYYVYAYLREDGTPYYVGKGTGKRAWVHCKNDVIHPPIAKNRIVILETQLSNIGALALERRYIRWYGRKDLGTGILRNKTDGGEGATGVKSKPFTTEHKEKLSEAWKKRRLTPVSTETREKLSAKRKGKPSPNKGLLVGYNKGKKLLTYKCPHCSVETTGGNLQRWHNDNCKRKNQ